MSSPTTVVLLLLALLSFSAAAATKNDATPSPYPLAPSNSPVIDAQAACDALRDSIPLALLHAAKTDKTAPMELRYVMTKLYASGANPRTRTLLGDIPPEAVQLVDGVTLDDIAKSQGEWLNSYIQHDENYGPDINATQEPASDGLPSFCRFGASIVTSDSSATWFETWLPLPANSTNVLQQSLVDVLGVPPANNTSNTTGGASRDNWRGRLVFVGSGGQRGCPSYPEMKQILTRYREATASSNLGHFGTGGQTNWSIGQPEAQIDFGHRGTHVAALAAQYVVKQFYAVEPPGKQRETISARGHPQPPSHPQPPGHPTPPSHPHPSPHSTFSPAFGFPAYYKGCSTGGRQGMAEANRYPYDFDGILAGSPAIYYNELNAYQIHVNHFQSNASSPRFIPTTLYRAIHDFILSECDTLDGLKDAVLEDPLRCKPNFKRLMCAPTNGTAVNATATAMSAASVSSTSMTSTSTTTTAKKQRSSSSSSSSTKTSKSSSSTSSRKSSKSPSSSSTSTKTSTSSKSSFRSTSTAASATSSATGNSTSTYAPPGACLTADQLANLRDIYTAYRYPNGDIIHEPVLYGSEMAWTINDGVVGKAFPPAPGWFQYQVLGRSDAEADFDYFNIVDNNFTLLRQARQADPGQTETAAADFRRFFRRGGKLMHYHGLSDQLIPPGASDRFYRAVSNVVGSAAVQNGYRYYHIPGMAHCRSGDGAWQFGGAGQTDDGSRPYQFDVEYDMLLRLFDWTENNRAPDAQFGASYKITSGDEPLDYVTTSKDDQEFRYGLKFTHRLCPYPQRLRVHHNSTTDQTCA